MNLYLSSLLLFVVLIFIFNKLKLNEYFSNKTKCFSCEKESKKKHPTSCYSCESGKNNILLNLFPQRFG